MTEKEKQIDELAIAIYETLKKINGIAFMVYSKDDYYHKCARELYSMGYRKQSEVAKEFIEKFKQRFFFMNGTMLSSPVYQCTGEELERFAAEYGVEVEK